MSAEFLSGGGSDKRAELDVLGITKRPIRYRITLRKCYPDNALRSGFIAPIIPPADPHQIIPGPLTTGSPSESMVKATTSAVQDFWCRPLHYIRVNIQLPTSEQISFDRNPEGNTMTGLKIESGHVILVRQMLLVLRLRYEMQ